jgi:competence protein ComEC
LLALAGGWLLCLPRGVSWRWGGILLLLPLVLPPSERLRRGEIELEVLDAGQGTAVLLSANGQSLLYDAGPGDGRGRDLVAGVIAPAAARLPDRRPKRIVVSHGDLDHAGGLASLARRYADSEFRVNPPAPEYAFPACRAPVAWTDNGVSMRVLHPGPGLPYLGNDSSCVLSIRTGDTSLLLAGDISQAVEQRLVRRGLQPHDVLLVPHHGSLTSSSPAFIRAVRPRIAIATAGPGNRFGFPKPEVRERYRAAGAEFWSTSDCGAIRLRYSAGDWTAQSARRRQNRLWRWPPGGNCP